MMFAALFGLSMHYEVLLVSQIAQHHAAGEPPRQAVRSGLASSAKVIAAAAIIMISVFGSFILNGDPTIKQFGVGLSVAVLLASAMVLSLAPAMLTLFGHAVCCHAGWTGCCHTSTSRGKPDCPAARPPQARPPGGRPPGPCPAPSPGPSRPPRSMRRPSPATARYAPTTSPTSDRRGRRPAA